MTYSFYLQEQYNAEEDIKYSIEDYDDKAKIWVRLFFDFLPDKTELPAIDGLIKVLDVGANTGYNTVLLEALYGYAEGIDVNPKLIKASKKNTPNCRLMSMTNMEYPNGSFSMVVAKDVLEHANDPDIALREIHRVLSDDGMFVCLIPLDGEVVGIDDVVISPLFNYGNNSHYWKATYEGVLRRLFGVGFTNIEVKILEHSKLFGVKRELGDRVVLIRCVKRNNIIKLPHHLLLGNSYWAAFITMLCTGNCKYCIQTLSPEEFHSAKFEYEKDSLELEEWLRFFNNIQKYKNYPLSIIGGEPTIHKDFYELVNGLNEYYITTTSNLVSPIFNSPKIFADSILNKNLFFEGKVYGKVSKTAKGLGGFGFDPIFIPNSIPNKTFAELTTEEKNKISHRGHAWRQFIKFLKENN